MKSSQFKNQIVFVAAISTAILASSAFAGEGGGYNGPVTAGASIPVALDRAVSLDALTRTYKVCMAKSATSLASQFVKMTPAEFNAAYETLEPAQAGGSYAVWKIGNLGADFSASFENQQVYYQFHSRSQQSPQSIQFAFDQIYQFCAVDPSGNCDFGVINGPKLYFSRPGEDNPKPTTFKAIDLPVATFKNTLKQAKYDELGNLDQSTVIVEGLALKLPHNAQAQIALVNAETDKPSALKLDLSAYVDCFYNEIQK